ncbi:MAG: phosphatase PAP2 family protein [Candidatus Aminicenantes bacterium]|nr:phosphatase PAP2 family protein [Candidatus Aminicenantes bacterium]
MFSFRNQNDGFINASCIWIWLPLVLMFGLAGVILLTRSNKEIFLLVNQVSQITGDRLWAVLTFFSDGLVSFVILLPFIHQKPHLVWSVLVAAVLFTLFGQGIKHITQVLRPPQIFSPDSFHLIGPDWGHNSFPSGHASMVFNLAGVFSLTVKKNWIRFLLIGLASVIAVSRIVVGVHWPVDILVGAAIGWITVWIGLKVSAKTTWGWNRSGRKILGAVLLVGCVLLFFVDYTGHENIMGFQRLIAVVFLLAGGHEYLKTFGWKGVL